MGHGKRNAQGVKVTSWKMLFINDDGEWNFWMGRDNL